MSMFESGVACVSFGIGRSDVNVCLTSCITSVGHMFTELAGNVPARQALFHILLRSIPRAILFPVESVQRYAKQPSVQHYTRYPEGKGYKMLLHQGVEYFVLYAQAPGVVNLKEVSVKDAAACVALCVTESPDVAFWRELGILQPCDNDSMPYENALDLEVFERLVHGFCVVRWDPENSDPWTNAVRAPAPGKRSRNAHFFEANFVRTVRRSPCRTPKDIH